MRFIRAALALALAASAAFAQDFDAPGLSKEKHGYQSDVARLRKIVINSLYSHREVFLRELISNANDAIEKLRLTALTDKQAWDGADPLNITIKAETDEATGVGRIVITDTGIGMTPEELTNNLGTLAKSGTSDFLSRAESSDSTGTGNLIGAFGLGFYSSFLVADKVYVASTAAKTAKNPNPSQYVFSSNADDSSFEIFPDPRGNTLGRGTEITLVLKPEAAEYLDPQNLINLIEKHSGFSTAFPIYLWKERTTEVPEDEPESAEPTAATANTEDAIPTSDAAEDADEAILEEVADETSEETVKPPPKMKTITVQEWAQTNPQPPIWMQDPKTVPDEDYNFFYQTTFKDHEAPLAWSHFTGDAGGGVSFRALIYLPARLPEDYWQNPLLTESRDIRLMVKRVFITADLGADALPKWANWVKVVVDADDLPLNVSRETLQSTKFLKQMKAIILKRLIQMLQRIANDDPEKWAKVQEAYSGVLKLGAVEDTKNREKLSGLMRFHTNQRNSTSLDQYVENKKLGQRQIFYLADMGKAPETLAKSVFVEKLDARGYEVLLLGDPLDEIMVQNIRRHKGMPFQDVAKAGLTFGDEELDVEEQKSQTEEFTERFKPLLDWLTAEASNVVRKVVISNRLVSSPVAIVADAQGYTANVERMMSASNKKQPSFMADFAKKQKILEINPKSPLIEGLLRRVERLPGPDEEPDLDAEEELKEATSILIDGALVRSGFEVPDSNLFFSRMDRVLRRSLGVSETAETDTNVRPAPPVDPTSLEEPEFNPDAPGVQLPEHLKGKVSLEMEEIDELGNVVNRPPPPPPPKAPEDDDDVVYHDEL